MEDVLDLYAEPYDAKRLVVCMDESPEQLLQDVREALLCKPGAVAKEDCDMSAEALVIRIVRHGFPRHLWSL